MFTATLSKNAKDALVLLGKSKILPRKTYLAGGSALALHFGHRISVDFDFFTPIHFDQDDLVMNLKKIGTFKSTNIAKDTLLGTLRGLKFSIFRYRYPLIFTPSNFMGINLADPKDIAAMKLAAIMDRGTKKDFIDLYFLAKKGISIDDSFNYYDKKYQALANNLYSLVKSLVFFEDAKKTDMPVMIEKVSWDEIKDFFRKEAIRLTHKYI